MRLGVEEVRIERAGDGTAHKTDPGVARAPRGLYEGLNQAVNVWKQDFGLILGSE